MQEESRELREKLATLSEDYRGKQCVAVWCNALQCVAVCCSVVQCVVREKLATLSDDYRGKQGLVVVCCSVLQCVAVCCSVLQCVGAGGKPQTPREPRYHIRQLQR